MRPSVPDKPGRPPLGNDTFKTVTLAGGAVEVQSRRSRLQAERYQRNKQRKTCISCGAFFFPCRRLAKTCSPKCRKALSRAIAKSMAEFQGPAGKCDKSKAGLPSGKGGGS